MNHPNKNNVIQVPKVERGGIRNLFVRFTHEPKQNNLTSEEWQRKKAKDIHDGLLCYLPSGVYRHLVKIMLEHDMKVNFIHKGVYHETN
jgi:hypothetical protein